MRPLSRISGLILLSMLFSACGGGGGGGSATGGSAAGPAGTDAASASGSGSGSGTAAGGGSGVSSGGGSGSGSGPATVPDITVSVSTANPHPISPWIYGLNSVQSTAGAPSGLTLDRSGGNRWTAYNWVTNASNAGSDYLYENDNYLSASTVPAAPLISQIGSDQNAGMGSIVTVQMQGLVAADESGAVSIGAPPDLTRFKPVVFAKASQSAVPFTTTPASSLPSVYMDEFVWALDQAFPAQGLFAATPAHAPVFVQLDNEPELWSSTHLEVQGPTPISVAAYLQKTVALATALKNQFPDLVILGPVHYGFEGLYNWQGALSATPDGNNWFADAYLAAIHTASASYGRALVDAYDFHWYSEATDGNGNRVTNLNAATLTDAQVQAIVQSPRSLWDTGYRENSWITSAIGQPIAILERLKSRIASENPGMKIAVTEYNNGGAQHIAGTLAQADNLGIFGAEGVFAASLWGLSNSQPYLLAGFSAFRNFDGSGANFGDVSLPASSSDVAQVSAYVSTDSHRAGRAVLVLINRSSAGHLVAVNGLALSGTAHLFRITAASAQGQSAIRPIAVGTQTVSGQTLQVQLPALSVTTVDVY